MRPIFTIHGGEYLVGNYLEKNFKNTNIWVPSKDIGIDFLITDRVNKKSLSLQVKFSRDFLPTHMPPEFQGSLRACGWWTLRKDKILSSKADFWVFVLVGFKENTTDFIVVKPDKLVERLEKIHGKKLKTIQTYLWVTEKDKCWETRGLKRQDHRSIVDGKFRDSDRDFSTYLNNWNAIRRLDKI